MGVAEFAQKIQPWFAWATGVFAVVAWIMLVNGTAKLHAALKKGEMMQQACGNEYFEIESGRYLAHETYDGETRKTMYATMVVWMLVNTAAMLGLTAMLVANMAVLIHKNTSIFVKVISIIAFILLALAWVAWIPIWAIFMNQKSYEDIDVKIADEESAKHRKAVLGTLMPMATAIVVLFVMYQFTTKGSDEVSLNTPTSWSFAVIWIFSLVTFLYVDNRLLYLKAWFSSYENDATAVNNALKNVSEGVDIRNAQAFKDELKNNIKRIDLGLQGDISDTSTEYSSKYYAYMEHRGGDEAGYIDTTGITAEKARLLFETLNARVMLYSPSATSMTANMNTALDNLITTKSAAITNNVQITQNELQTIVNDNIVTSHTILLKDSLATALVDHKTTAPRDIRVAQIRTFCIQHIKDELKDTSTEENVLSSFATALSSTLYFNGSTNVDASHDQDEVDIDRLINIIKSVAATTTFGSALAKTSLWRVATDTLDRLVRNSATTGKDAKETVIAGMRKLRKSPVTQEAHRFINFVFWVSVLSAFVIAFLLFHKYYATNSEMATIVASLVGIGFVVALSTYGWFMGQIFL